MISRFQGEKPSIFRPQRIVYIVWLRQKPRMLKLPSLSIPLRLSVVLMASLLWSCSKPHSNSESRPSHTVVRVLNEAVSTLDPHKATNTSEARVALDLFEGLTAYGPDATPIPGLADSWSTSSDGKSWRFHVRRDARFSDHTPITAHDIVYSFQRAIDPATAAPNARLLCVIERACDIIAGLAAPVMLGVRAPAADIVEITLTRPTPALPELLSLPIAAVVPIRTLSTYGPEWTLPKNIVTSGAFMVEHRRSPSDLLLSKNHYFHDAEQVRALHVSYVSMTDRTAALRAFRNNQVDLLQDFLVAQAPQLVGNLRSAIHITDARGTYYLIFNSSRPPFNAPQVRQALSMTADRTLITQKILGLGHKPAYAILPPTLSKLPVLPVWARKETSERVAEAKRLLNAAGFSREHPLTFQLKMATGSDYRGVLQALVSLWQPLDIQVTLQVQDQEVHQSALRQGDFEVAESGQMADYASADHYLENLARQLTAFNFNDPPSQGFEMIYAQALVESDPNKRASLLRTAEQYLVDDAVILPLFTFRTQHLVGSQLHGWRDNAANVMLSRYLWVDRHMMAGNKAR